MNDLDNILDKVPKKTPGWAIGVVTIIVAVVASIVTVYVTAGDPIKQAILWAEANHEKGDDFRFKLAQDAEQHIMQILQRKSEQILELSKAVATTQQNNFVLLQRVTILEKDVAGLKSNLSDCENKLKDCEGRHK